MQVKLDVIRARTKRCDFNRSQRSVVPILSCHGLMECFNLRVVGSPLRWLVVGDGFKYLDLLVESAAHLYQIVNIIRVPYRELTPLQHLRHVVVAR